MKAKAEQSLVIYQPATRQQLHHETRNDEHDHGAQSEATEVGKQLA